MAQRFREHRGSSRIVPAIIFAMTIACSFSNESVAELVTYTVEGTVASNATLGGLDPLGLNNAAFSTSVQFDDSATRTTSGGSNDFFTPTSPFTTVWLGTAGGSNDGTFSTNFIESNSLLENQSLDSVRLRIVFPDLSWGGLTLATGSAGDGNVGPLNTFDPVVPFAGTLDNATFHTDSGTNSFYDVSVTSTSLSSAAVPEPNSLLLSMIGGCALLQRRRRRWF